MENNMNKIQNKANMQLKEQERHMEKDEDNI